MTEEGGDPACWAHLFEDEEIGVKFKAELKLNGKTATGMEVPENVVEALGGGKRPAVVVSFRGYSYRTTVAPMGGKYLIGVNADHRTASGVKAGDKLDVEVVLDTVPREVEVPAYIASALEQAGVRAAYDKLSYTNRKELVRSVEDAKTNETRDRRLAKAIEKLKD